MRENDCEIKSNLASKPYDRPAKIKQLIESWLSARDQCQTVSKQKSLLLKPVYAARKRKEAEQSLKNANADVQLWYAYLDGVEGKKRASHDRSVHFDIESTSEGMIQQPHIDVVETTMMMTATEQGTVGDNTEPPTEPIISEPSTEPINPGPSTDMSTTLPISCASPVKVVQPLLEDPSDILNASKLKRDGSKASVSSKRRLEIEAAILEEKAHAEVMALQEEFELHQKQRELELEAQNEAHELAAVRRKNDLELKLKRRELEVDNGSSRDSLSSVSSSVRAKNKTSRWVNCPENQFGSGDAPPPSTIAKEMNFDPVTSNANIQPNHTANTPPK